MKKSLKWILLVVVVVVVVLLVATRTSGDDGAIKVTAEEVQLRTIEETVVASGKLYPENEVRISTPVAGEVTQLNVSDGDTVKKGDILAIIKGERTTSSPAVSLSNVPPGMQGLVQQMQPRSGGPATATIKAPIDGIISSLNIRKGERVGGMQLQSGELMRVADMSQLEVRVDVNETDVIKISNGDSAMIEVEAYDKRRFKGVVTGISNSSSKRDAASFMSNDVTSYEVHVRLDPSSYRDLFDSGRKQRLPFRSGMNARAIIRTTKKENVVAVPVAAVTAKPVGSEQAINEKKKLKKDDEEANPELFQTALEEIVYVITAADTVAKRVVNTGIQDMDYYQVTEGLKPGEKVVTGPYQAITNQLRTGKKVKVVSQEALFQNN